MRSDRKLKWLVVCMGVAFPVAGAQAAIITVNSTGDSGSLTQCANKLDECTLRGAITKANASAGDDTIRFSTGAGTAGCDGDGNCTINLGSALPNVTGNLSIEGPTTKTVTIKRNVAAAFRIFTIDPGLTISMSNLTITNGQTDIALGGGGGIYNRGSQLTVRNCVVTGNTSNHGGGIWNTGATGHPGSLVLINSTISGNVVQPAGQSDQVEGGGVFNSGGLSSATVLATNCVFSGNMSSNSGAGLASNSASMTVVDCTFQNNSASYGGGISTLGPANTNPPTMTAVVTGSTFIGNTATQNGGGVFSLGGSFSMTNCTISGNSSTTGEDSSIKQGAASP